MRGARRAAMRIRLVNMCYTGGAMQREPQVILVTGASSGIGRAAATLLSTRGHRVYGTIRRPLPEAVPFKTVTMDVTDEHAVNACVDDIITREGRIHAAVNCAGYGIAGSVEDTSLAEAQQQFDTNFFGTLRVCRAVLPDMRRRGRGLIVKISSMGGLVSAPFHGLYCASKFAVEGLTEALRMEAAPFGVRVVLVEPGDFKTRFTENRLLADAARSNPAYTEYFEQSLRAMEQAERSGPGPHAVARLIEKILRDPDPPLRHVAASGEQRLVPLVRRLLPQELFGKIIARHFGLR